MKTFQELKQTLFEATKSGVYKKVKYKITKVGSTYALYVDNEKIDIFRTEKEAEKAAKEFIDFGQK